MVVSRLIVMIDGRTSITRYRFRMDFFVYLKNVMDCLWRYQRCRFKMERKCIMNDWIVLRSFTNHKKCWYVRVKKLQATATMLNLDLSTCECAGVPAIIQDWLNQCLSSECFYRGL